MNTFFRTTLSCCIAALAACHHSDAAEAPPSAQVDDNGVRLPASSQQLKSLSVEATELSDAGPVQLNGRLALDDAVTVRVFTPFGGRVVSIAVDVGQSVTCGATLAAITSPDLGQAQANARKAAADLLQAERNQSRLAELLEHGAVPKKDLQAAEADLQRAQSEQQRTALQLAAYGSRSDAIDQTFQLKAPLEGVVVEKNINPGQEVRPDMMLANVPQLAAPLFTISDPRRLWIQIDAGEADLAALAVGQSFVVRSRAYPDHAFHGRIDVIADVVDPTTRMVKVRGSVDNQDRLLKAEMFVTVELDSHEGKVLAVPSTAVFLQGERHYLFVQKEPGSFLRREVGIGRQSAGRLIVRQGLQPGEAVVSSGCMLLEQLFQQKG